MAVFADMDAGPTAYLTLTRLEPAGADGLDPVWIARSDGVDLVEHMTLSVTAQAGEYIVSIYDQEIEEVRVPTSGVHRSGNSFGSTEWSLGIVWQDADLVRQCFEQFVTTGDVSRDLLS